MGAGHAGSARVLRSGGSWFSSEDSSALGAAGSPAER